MTKLIEAFLNLANRPTTTKNANLCFGFTVTCSWSFALKEDPCNLPPPPPNSTFLHDWEGHVDILDGKLSGVILYSGS